MFGWKNKTTGMPRRSIETSGAYDGGLGALTHGLVAGTRIASNLGWRAVEALAAGDKVLTFDHGMREITEIRRTTLWLDESPANAALLPMIVPVGALDNRAELTLLPDQGVLVESDTAAEMYGDPFAVIPVHSLEGVRGIRRAATDVQIDLISVYFADEQVIYAEGGALIHCPANTTALATMLDAKPASYDVLSTHDAVFLAECLVMEDAILASVGWVDSQMTVRC